MKTCAVMVSSQHKDPQTVFRLYNAAVASGAEELALWRIDDCETERSGGPFGRVKRAVPDAARFYSAEGLLPVLETIYAQEKPELVLFPADTAGTELGVRLAARTGAACMSNVRSLEGNGRSLIVRKMAYNGYLEAAFALAVPAVATVMTDAFAPVGSICEPAVETLRYMPGDEAAWSMDEEYIPAKAGQGLRSFRNVVACGRGMGQRSNMAAAERLAELLDGAVAGTRPVAVDGWVAPDRLIGISGSFIQAKLCLVLGASGARAFTTGIKDCAFLIGVNTDETASIFSSCDAGAVCDCVEFAQALADILEAEKGR